MNFEFTAATRIVFGAGKLNELPALARGFGSRGLLVTGRNAGRAEELMNGAGVSVATYRVSGEPEIETVERGVAVGRAERCEFIVGVGGGSVLDAAKAIAAMLANEGELLDYVEIIGRGRVLSKTSLSFVAVPTTAGTGSEVTRNAVLSSPGHKLKVSLRSPLMLARVALVDPELTDGLPPTLTASTGLDALTQLIEPYVCSRANPMTDGLCVEGVRRAAQSLRAAFENGRDKRAREDMALASLFGGLALANAGLGAVHGFAGPIGGMFGAPHGAICAALLPQVMEANIQALRKRAPGGDGLRRFNEVGRLLTGHAQAGADDAVAWVRELTRDLGIARLGTYGIADKDVAEIVEKAQQSSSMKANPVALTREELTEVLRKAM